MEVFRGAGQRSLITAEESCDFERTAGSQIATGECVSLGPYRAQAPRPSNRTVLRQHKRKLHQEAKNPTK